MENEKLRLSYSKIKCFLTCRKKFQFEYIEKLSPKQKSFPLQVGDIVHQLLQEYREGRLTAESVNSLKERVATLYPNNSQDLTDDVVQQASSLLLGYINRWKDSKDIKVISNETWLELELSNFILYGRVDSILRTTSDNALWRGETKTAARVDSHYLNGLKGGLQGAIYDFLAETLIKEELKGTMYDLLVKKAVPEYLRNFAMKNRSMKARMLACCEGVAKDIKSGDFYPSCDCFLYNSECPFRTLCEHDSPAAREAFYETRKSPFDEVPIDKVKQITQ